MVDGTLAAGATSMDSLSFRVADPRPPSARRASWRWPPPGPGPTSSPRPPACRSSASATSSKGARRPPMPLPKAERMMLAADVATPVEAGSLEVAVTVTVTYRAR